MVSPYTTHRTLSVKAEDDQLEIIGADPIITETFSHGKSRDYRRAQQSGKLGSEVFYSQVFQLPKKRQQKAEL